MKRLLLPLIAALSLSNPANAESYEASLAREQWPKMQKLYENSLKFIDMGDMTSACTKYMNFDILLEMNFEGLQEIMPETDWFEVKKITNKTINKWC
tara:strand:- start:84 stop:374 length:291 start_codon:yes stop_codon:yes gene_type:complete